MTASAVNKLNIFEMAYRRKFEHSPLIQEGVDLQPTTTDNEITIGNIFSDKHNLVRSKYGATSIAKIINETTESVKAWFISIGIMIKTIILLGFIFSCISLFLICKGRRCTLLRNRGPKSNSQDSMMTPLSTLRVVVDTAQQEPARSGQDMVTTCEPYETLTPIAESVSLKSF